MKLERRLDELERRTTTGERLTFRVEYDGMPEPDGWEEVEQGRFTVLWPIYDEEAEDGND